MPKKNTKQVQGKLETVQIGPITVDKSGDVVIKINAKPGAKNNNITGDFLNFFTNLLPYYEDTSRTFCFLRLTSV